ncbi:MAG: diaminopimelate decarboxylase [Natronospirillum sp.]|uniref:diaminopimelate decarboxylase n=1 Tax=Natronospirillum sp. TaxID=2812955 RepID=UPI0025D52FCD|nr:diaminopimelate decarboxylase [Natronospirillum sp.]MCH8551479.1 diaminopimelate decarboxylase [Natronospirillum sp.]
MTPFIPFLHDNNCLHAEQVPVEQLAETFGTPLYVYSRQALISQYQRYQSAVSEQDMICYAVKANSNLAVLRTLADQGAGFDIVSGGELERVLAAGGDPARVVFSGVGKQPAEMQRALEVGIHCFNVESLRELEQLQAVAASLETVARVSLRVNPDVDARTHPYISTGLKANKFGVPVEDAETFYLQARDMAFIEPVGVDCHIGSQLTETEPLLEALDSLLVLVGRLRTQGIELVHVDMGGGLGVSYEEGEQPPDIEQYIAIVHDRLAAQGLHLILEPGRSIVADAGMFLTRVSLLKTGEEKNFAVVDGAMNDLLRPALYGAWQRVVPVTPRPGKPALWDIVGPICETGDFLAKDRELVLAEGDLLAVMQAGAYGFVMSSNYNTRPRAAEVMVDGDKAHLVRRRETLSELLAAEQELS